MLVCHPPNVSGITAWRQHRARLRREEDERKREGAASDRIGAHRENVWLAVGSIVGVGGIALVTAAWLGFIALAVKPSASHPSWVINAAGWVILAIGGYGFYWGIRVFRFRGWPPLPLTFEEKREIQAAALEAQQTTVEKTQKAGTAAKPA